MGISPRVASEHCQRERAIYMYNGMLACLLQVDRRVFKSPKIKLIKSKMFSAFTRFSLISLLSRVTFDEHAWQKRTVNEINKKKALIVDKYECTIA